MNDGAFNIQKQLQNLQSQLSGDSNTASPSTLDNDVDVENEDFSDSALWSIDDPMDTLFCAQGLVNHSGVTGKSVFVTWNENYLINFVFKISRKTQRTTLTKVRLTLPTFEDEQEELKQMSILEFNTLLLMHSGRVYCFSSVKSLQLIDWLSGVRCISSGSSCTNTFSLIRLKSMGVEDEEKKHLCLEVFQDCVNFGKSNAGNEFLLHSYDITFDEQNLFECCWEDERYTLLNLIVTAGNIDFLKKLINIGTNFIMNENEVNLEEQQNIQIFTISGNVFILIGGGPDCLTSDKTVDAYRIHNLNTYASKVESIQIDCEKQLLIVLLQCGNLDIWFKSNKCNGALLHKAVQVNSFIHYDYCTISNTFYFITVQQVTQLKILVGDKDDEDDDSQECLVIENHKLVGGMMACTWVDSLQQLVCLSCNNIFYRLTFDETQNTEHDKHENLTQLYVLTERRIKELLLRAEILKDLHQQPQILYEQIEHEYQKQLIIAMANKSHLLSMKFKARLEYNTCLPNADYFSEDVMLIKTQWKRNDYENIKGGLPYYLLIYIKLDSPDESLLEAFTTSCWYLQILDDKQSIFLYLPGELLKRQLCLITDCCASPADNNKHLKHPQLKLTTFLHRNSHYLCINIDIDIQRDRHTFKHIFNRKMQHLNMWSNCNDLSTILNYFNRVPFNSTNATFKYTIPLQRLEDFKEILSSLDVKCDNWQENIKLYFLGHNLIIINYDETQKNLILSSQFPNDLFYFKLHCMYVLQAIDVKVCTMQDTSKHFKYIMQLQCDIHPFECNNISLHLENLRRIYTKLRTELSEIFR